VGERVSTRRWLAGIVAAGVVLRLGWGIYAARPPVGLHDPGFYRLLGEQLASGNGYRLPDGSPTAYYPVGYPLALALGFLLTPVSWQTGVVVALNVACQAATIMLVFATTRRLLEGRDVPALVAAGTVALWPNLVLHSAVPLSESLFIALVLAAVFVVVSGPWPARGSSGNTCTALRHRPMSSAPSRRFPAALPTYAWCGPPSQPIMLSAILSRCCDRNSPAMRCSPIASQGPGCWGGRRSWVRSQSISQVRRCAA
jgi:hypothetical protein